MSRAEADDLLVACRTKMTLSYAEVGSVLATLNEHSAMNQDIQHNPYCACQACGGPALSAADMLLQDSIETLGTVPDKPLWPERFVTYNNQAIDLERVMYLETFKTGNGYWIILDGSTWNSESDCYNNAPYIQSDVAEEFKQVWMTYLTYKKN